MQIRNIAIYNMIFHIINLFIKCWIQITFKFYINYYEVNINHIYHMIIVIIINKIKKNVWDKFI